MNEDTNNETHTIERVITHNTGVHPGIVVFLGVLLMFTALTNAYYLLRQKPENAACAQTNATQQAQAEAEKAKSDFGVAIQKRIDNMQMEVAKFCVASHGVPVLNGGNVDCKKEK